MKGKYFNDDAEFGTLEFFSRLDVVQHGDGFQVRKSMSNPRNGDVIAYCDSKEEAEELKKNLCEIGQPSH